MSKSDAAKTKRLRCGCRTTPLKKTTHCVFDLDGTLLDTETVYARIISEMLTERGKNYTTATRAKLFGRNVMDAWSTAIEIYGLEEAVGDVVAEFKGRCAAALRNRPLLPGVEKLVRHLHEKGVPLAIATSSDGDNFLNKTEHLPEFFALFHHAVTAGTDPEVKRGKPCPDVFLVCASRFEAKPEPGECLVFEDSPNGVEGALAAGMGCVWIPDPTIPRELAEGADLVLNSLEEFRPEEFGLPAF